MAIDDDCFYHNGFKSFQHTLPGTPTPTFTSFTRKICEKREEIIFEHEFNNRIDMVGYFVEIINIQMKVIQQYNIVGIECYTIILTLNGSYAIATVESGRIFNKIYTDYIRNIPYIPQSVLESIQLLEIKKKELCKTMLLPEEGTKNMLSILAKFKQKIMDKLNEDPTYQELSQLNIVHEVQQLKIKNEKTKQKYKIKLSDMKTSIQQLQEDMKILFAKTAELQEENKLLKQEKETLSITTKIGQSLVDEDLLNCM